MTAPEDEDDAEGRLCYGGAKPGDGNYADVFAVDSDIVACLVIEIC